jgi:integrase/recombinase XerC
VLWNAADGVLMFARRGVEDGLVRVLGKGGKTRIVPVGRAAVAALQAHQTEAHGRP